MIRKILTIIFLLALIFASAPTHSATRAQSSDGDPGSSQQAGELDQARVDEEIEATWQPDYLHLATGDPTLQTDHGVYEWPFDIYTIGWTIQSYQDYGGEPYFHHGTDLRQTYGTQVFNRSGGQVVNIENYNPGNPLYWEVAVLDPDGYLWQYHHIEMETIPQNIWDAWYAYQVDPVLGHIPPDTHIGNIIFWPVESFHHIHLNIIAENTYYVNGFEFHVPLPDTDIPEIQAVGLLQNGQMYGGNTIQGDYSLYVQSRDLIKDSPEYQYYLPPWRFAFSIDGGPEQVTWQFDRLPGNDRSDYLNDFYVVPPTCGDYYCRNYVVDLGFIPDSHYTFPWTGGEHTITVTVSDYAGNTDSQSFTYTVIGSPPGEPVWQDDFESDLGWVPNPDGTDTASDGLWERGDPEQTYSSGIKQLGTAPTEVNDLVTGRLAGSSAPDNDVDGGVTSMRSPLISLPQGSELTLSFMYYLAHTSTSSSDDYLRLTVIGEETLTVFEELGAATNDDGAWAMENVSISSFAGQEVYLLLEAADEAGESLVEAGIDNVVIIATGTNQAPVADAQSVSTAEDTALDITLSGSDPDGDPLTYSIFSPPVHGTLSGTPPEVTYTPDGDYSGADSFSFQVNDGTVSSEPATVSLDVTPVNDAPVAEAQSLSTPEDTPLAILLSGFDVDGDPLTYTLVSTPTNGALGGIAPNLVYTPTADYNGADSFSFVVSDGQDSSAPATVSIQVEAVNDAPTALAQTVTTFNDRPVEITLTGTDVDGDPLAYTIVLSPVHGTLSGTGASLTYTPEPGYVGADSFAFTVSDGQLESPAAVVSIEVYQLSFVALIYK